MCTPTGPATSSWTTTTHLGHGRRRAGLHLCHLRWRRRRLQPADQPFLQINLHLRFFNAQRRYVWTRETPDRLDADFTVVPFASTPDAPAYVRASFAVEDRIPGLHQTYDRPLETPLQRRQRVRVVPSRAA
jgi:hypothetical protein